MHAIIAQGGEPGNEAMGSARSKKKILGLPLAQVFHYPDYEHPRLYIIFFVHILYIIICTYYGCIQSYRSGLD